jgi:hypothetical protein
MMITLTLICVPANPVTWPHCRPPIKIFTDMIGDALSQEAAGVNSYHYRASPFIAVDPVRYQRAAF